MTNLKLILYGLGQGLNLVEERIKKEHEIIGYMDSYSQISVFRGKLFYKLKDIRQLHFDYIVITIRDRKMALNIYYLLSKEYKIPESRIIPFYVYANYETYRIKLKECDPEKIQGLIFGNSYAECGYLEDEFNVPFLNLAVSSQDIYYNYKIFQSCIREYGERLKRLSYIVIDLYDYYYFNIDTSMSTHIINYIFWGGYLDEHNFRFNHHYRNSFKKELKNVAYIPEKTFYMQFLFDDISVKCGVCATSRWKHMDESDLIKVGSAIRKSALNRHEITIEENKRLLNRFLREIRDFDSEIKVIFTLIPRYIKMELETEPFMKSWKEEFIDSISDMCKMYNTFFLNYKNRTDISSNDAFYYDIEHLNTAGARALTSILDEDLKKL